MSLWSRWAILRSDGGISAIFARQSASASALLPLAFRSLINSFIAAFSSAVNTLEAARRVGFFVAGIGSLLLRPGLSIYALRVAVPHPRLNSTTSSSQMLTLGPPTIRPLTSLYLRPQKAQKVRYCMTGGPFCSAMTSSQSLRQDSQIVPPGPLATRDSDSR